MGKRPTSNVELPTSNEGGKNILPVHVRWMIRADMDEVLAIEQASFEFPWDEGEFVRKLRQRNCIGMVAEAAGPFPGMDPSSVEYEYVAGYMIYELKPTRLHLLNFAVDPGCRRRGVGRQMLEKLTGKLCRERRARLVTEVRETHVEAQLFLRACGLRAVETLRGRYRESEDDAYVFQARVGA